MQRRSIRAGAEGRHPLEQAWPCTGASRYHHQALSTERKRPQHRLQREVEAQVTRLLAGWGVRREQVTGLAGWCGRARPAC